MTTKECRSCCQHLPESAFYPRSRKCRTCFNAVRMERYRETSGYVRGSYKRKPLPAPTPVHEQIRHAAIDVRINHLPLPCLQALLAHTTRDTWLAADFNGQDFRTYALFVAEAISNMLVSHPTASGMRHIIGGSD